MKIPYFAAMCSLFAVCPLFNSAFAVGESAVITLVFPPGARATGMGESFIAVADDPNATFYNPAGLGQAPLAHSWKKHNVNKDVRLTAIAARKKIDFGRREKVWIGTNKGLLRYNGKAWESYETYVIESEVDNSLYSIAEKYIFSDDEVLIRQAVTVIMDANGIEKKKSAEMRKVLSSAIPDSQQNKNSEIEDMIFKLLALDKTERSETKIYGLIASRVDSSSADSAASRISKAFDISDTRFEDLVELKIPFDIAVNDSVTALAIDLSERLWVGTAHGLWSFDGKSWNYMSILDGIPSNNITALAIGSSGEIAVGTDRGIAVMEDGRWNIAGIEQGLPDSAITSVVFGTGKELWVGTPNGLAHRQDSSWISYDTSDGLLSTDITALMFDSENKIWIGSGSGVTVYSGTSWKRYKFPGSRVNCIAEHKEGRVWIGTNKGAISYKEGKRKTGEDDKKRSNPPVWKAYHSKNALTGDDVAAMAVHGKDMWLVTDKAVNQYDRADLEFLFFYEPILPAFGITDLWHIYTSFIIPTEDWGTIGISVNYLNFGENTWTDEMGRELGKARSWEGVAVLSYGLPVKQDLSLGINVKYVHSALAPGFGPSDEGVGRTFAVDAAMLKRNLFVPNLSLGFNLQNMGPSIFYIEREESDPIPFNVNFGLAYTIFQTSVHDLKIVGDINREIVKNYVDKRPDPFYKAIWTDLIDDPDDRWDDELFRDDMIYHIGAEYWYVNFIALRLGFMEDPAGYRRELSFGLGLRYGNLGVDWSYIHEPGRSDKVRTGQWRLSLLAKL